MAACGIIFSLFLTSCGDTGDTKEQTPESSPGLSSPGQSEKVTPTANEAQLAVPQDVAEHAGSASFQIDDDSFEFLLKTCLISEADILATGPGSNLQSGGKAFLDVDFTEYEGDFVGGIRVTLGTGQAFSSTDDYYQLDLLFNSENFTTTIDSNSLAVEGMFTGYGQTALPPETTTLGTLTLNCDAH